MSKIYQEIEKILKFRIYSNAEISSYMHKMSLMGKIDDVKRHAILTLILTKLGELEDQEPATTYTTSSTPTVIADYVTGHTDKLVEAAPMPLQNVLDVLESDRQAKIKEQRIENMRKARAAKKAT